jgi:hypothetical protein
VLSGGFGHIFGNCPIWHFGYSASWCGLTDWQTELDGTGSINMQYFQRLLHSRHWDRLVPDVDHAVLTGGYGTWGQPDYATAASTADGTSIIAYLPTQRTVTVDTRILAGGDIRAWWFAPAAGTATAIGTFVTGIKTFTPPGAGDWVLVVDDAALGWPPPGEELPAVPAPSAEDMGTLYLAPNDPNPFNQATALRFSVGSTQRVRVAVYNLAGALVRTLVDAEFPAGWHTAVWDGRTDRGTSASAGVYLCRVSTAGASTARKLVLTE